MKATRQQVVEILRYESKRLLEAEHRFLQSICIAHDEDGLTFREITEALDRKGVGAVHHLYRKGKNLGF